MGTAPWSPMYYVTGLIDELRISNTARNAAWIQASYYSESDQLIEYGSEQLRPVPEFPLGALPALGVGFAIFWAEVMALRRGNRKALRLRTISSSKATLLMIAVSSRFCG
jgi:hypothetical protein